MNLLPRPFKLDPDFIARLVWRAVLALLMAVFMVGVIIWNHPLPDEAVMLAMSFGLAIYGVIRMRPYLRLRAIAREGEEAEAEVIGAVENGEFRLRLGNIELVHVASHADYWPLFLDAARTRALVLRRRGRFLVVRNDFHPFDFTSEEEQAIRKRLEQLRQLRKLVSDIHTC